MAAIVNKTLTGQRVPRPDAPAKILGQAGFGVDFYPPGCLHGRVIRAMVPHGRIKAVRFSPEVDWSEFHLVTAADIPGVNVVPGLLPDQPFLAAAEVKFAGEPVLLAAHADPAVLAAIHRFITIEVEELPACLDLRESLARRAILYGEDNVFKTVTIRKGDAAGVLASGRFQVIEGTYETPSQEQLYLESQNMIAYNDHGRIRVAGSLQCPYFVKPAVEAALGQPVDIIQTTTGGAFGGKEDYPSLLAAWAALLAWRSGRTVKMVFDRPEDMAFTTKRHPSLVRIRTAVDGTGRIQAMATEFNLDGGAYCTLSAVVLSRGAIHAGGVYRIPDVAIDGRVLATNTPPTGAFRGFGAPQAFFALERHMDVVAHRLGLDPVELRRRNLLRDGDTMATSQLFKWQDNLEGVLERAVARSRFAEKSREYERWNQSNAWCKRGIGLALFFHGCGFTGGGESRMRSRVRLEAQADGTVVIRVASVEMGQGARTVLAQITAEAIGLPLAAVGYPNPDTAVVPNSGPTVASRTTAVVGALLERSARQLRQRVEEKSASTWTDAPGFARALAAWAPAEFPLVAEAEYERPPGMEWDEETHCGDAYADYSWACYVAEVEADLRDYSVRSLQFTAVQDIGRVIQPDLARGQVEGGVVQGLGLAFYEKVHFREGRVVNAGFSDYIIPTAVDVPPIIVEFLENASPVGGAGAKGVGELPMDGVAPAAINALGQALGVEINAVPVLAPDVLSIWREKISCI